MKAWKERFSHFCTSLWRISEKGTTNHAYDAHIDREIQKVFHLSNFYTFENMILMKTWTRNRFSTTGVWPKKEINTQLSLFLCTVLFVCGTIFLPTVIVLIHFHKHQPVTESSTKRNWNFNCSVICRILLRLNCH